MGDSIKTARLVAGYFRHNLMSAMAYRGAFILQVVGMLLNDLMLLFFWWILFQRLPTLQGWDLGGVMTIYGVVAFGFGLAHVACGNAFRVAQVIASGDLDYYLTLPADPLVHLIVSRMSLPAWGDILFGLVVFILAGPERWLSLPLFVLLGLLTALVMTAFAVIVGSLSFWIGNADAIALQAVNALTTFSLYPVDIFPPAVRVLLYTVIPAAFVGSVPAALLEDLRWQNLVLMIAFTAGIVLVAAGVFYRGLRRYESGNRVTVRG
ncbi:MAG: ABC-2 family transporter protein [Anaerolineae bacterium]|nr:ABC-2 family transporter protein [Anaerolineae bacterium]